MRYTGEAHIQYFGPSLECASRVPDARVFLGEVLNALDTAETPAGIWVTKTFPDKSSYRVWTGYPPVIQIIIPPPDPTFRFGARYQIVLPWQPEGLLLTPTQFNFGSDPTTIGLPMRDTADPLGTPLLEYTQNGKYPQILINKYQNNKYLDDVAYMSGLPEDILEQNLQPSRNPRLNAQYPHAEDSNIPFDEEPGQIRWEYGVIAGSPASYRTPDEGEEITLESVYEFDYTFEPLQGGIFELQSLEFSIGADTYPAIISRKIAEPEEISEPESEDWYVHRPEELLYEFAIQEGIYQRTNFFRTEEGVADPDNQPFLRSLRGAAPAGYWGCYEIGTSEAKYWGHSHPDFRPGLRTAGGRNAASTGQEFGANSANNPCENAAATIPVGANALEKGEFVTQLWRDSPGHYAVIIDTLFEPDNRATSVDIDFSTRLLDGTSLDVGAYSITVNYETYFDVNSTDPQQDLPYWNETTWTFGKSEGKAVYTQIFQQRETWLPAPLWSRKTPYGSVGLWTNPNRYGGKPVSYQLSFSVGPRIYEIPFGTYPSPVAIADAPVSDDETDPFLGIIGVWPFEVDSESSPTGKVRYIRLVCVEGDSEINLLGQTNPEAIGVGTYVDVVTYVLPAALTDTGRMSWRDPKYQSLFEESRQRFDSNNGLLAIPPTHAEFSDDGSRFAFQMYEVGTPQTTHSILNSFQWGNTTIGTWYENMPQPLYPMIPRAVEWRNGSWIIQPSQAPVINEVLEASNDEFTLFNPSSGFETVSSYKAGYASYGGFFEVLTARNIYKRRCVGGYDMFPHYNPGGTTLQYVRVVTNEYQYHDVYRTDNPALTVSYPEEGVYGWIQRKLVYPDGEEFIYYQNYWDYDIPRKNTATIDDLTYNSEAGAEQWEITLDSFEKTGTFGFYPVGNSSVLRGAPGDGVNFLCVIHNWNVVTKEMVYSKEILKESYWHATSDPNPGSYDKNYTNGDTFYAHHILQTDKYIFDYDGQGTTSEVFSELAQQPSIDTLFDFGPYVGFRITSPDELWSNLGPADLELIRSSRSLNDPRNNGVSLPRTDSDASSVERLCFVTNFWPKPLYFIEIREGPYTNNHERVLSTAIEQSPVETASFDADGGQMYLAERRCWEDYQVSCATSPLFYRQGLNVSLANIDLLIGGAQPHNIAPPMINNPFHTRTNMLSYKGRRAVRIFARHWPSINGLIPPNNLLAFGSNLGDLESWLLDDIDPNASPPNPNVFIKAWANFDIVTPSGLSSVDDIWPCAVLE